MTAVYELIKRANIWAAAFSTKFLFDIFNLNEPWQWKAEEGALDVTGAAAAADDDNDVNEGDRQRHL